MKNICFKMKKYLHIINVQESLRGTQMTLLWRQGSDLSIQIRVSEFLSDNLWDSHWIQDRGNPGHGKDKCGWI
jgi:hypothetical protein